MTLSSLTCRGDQPAEGRYLEVCRGVGLGTATLRDRSRFQGGRCCADEVKPILRLRGEGPVQRKCGRRKSCDGRRIKPSAKRQRLAEELNAVHEVQVEEFTGTDTCEFVVHDGRWLDRRLSDKRKSQAESENRTLLLMGEAHLIRGRELELNSLLCRLNVMVGWVPVAEAIKFDKHVRSTSTRSVTLERPYGYRYLSVYHVLLFRALHLSSANHLAVSYTHLTLPTILRV